MTDDLVERVGRELAGTGYAFAGIDLTDPYTADADYWNSQARAAIAVLRPALRAEALEEAAKVCDARSQSLKVQWESDFKRNDMLEGAFEEADDCAAAIRALVKHD